MKRSSILRSTVAAALIGSALALASTVVTTKGVPPAGAAQPGPQATPRGYWLGARDGGIFSYGDATFQGSTGGQRLNRPIVGMAPTATGKGYFLVASDGGIFTFGDAVFRGSAGSLPLKSPVVGIAVTPSGNGYWLVSADGGIFSYGDAPFKGSMGGKKLNRPIVAMAGSATGQGYWLVASDGGIFTFGDAPFRGSQGAKPLNRPIVGMAASPSGQGYWMVATDGGIFTFGDSPFAGSTGAMPLNQPIVGMAPTPSGQGYWLVASDGGIFSFGDASFFGSAGSLPLAQPVIGMAAVPRRHSAEVVAFYYPWYGNPTYDGDWVHWQGQDQNSQHSPPNDIAADYYPVRQFQGPYSSSDPNTLNQQFAEIHDAGIDEVVVSWWGKGSFEDTRLGGVAEAAAAHGVRVGIHIETYGGRTPDSIGADITYLKAKGYKDFWIFLATSLPADQMAGVIDRAGDVRVMADMGFINGGRGGQADWAVAAHATGIYVYNPVINAPSDFAAICGLARQRSLLCAATASPGFTKSRWSNGTDHTFVDRANGATYDAKWNGVVSASADIAAITSYNEWHEGTQIEPAKAFCTNNGCYLNYEGAYGQSGDAAPLAYLGATRQWVDRFRATGS
jgi:hypothetical protein